MTRSTILHIGATKEVLTKQQKEFNRLTKKIEQLEKTLAEFRRGRDILNERHGKEMAPLFREMHACQVEIVKGMDKVFPDKIFKKTDHKKLSYLITDTSFDLISKHGYEDLKIIFNKYNEHDYDTVNAEVDRQAADMAKGMASFFGVEFEDDVDISTTEKFHEKMFEKISEQEEILEEEQRIFDEKKAAKKKTQKQLDREEEQKNEELRVTKSVRSVYMDLVKALHPDREKDEAEKQRKTEIMQRVTQAYNDNNLMALLKLQMEFDRIDKEHLERLADEQLLYYNKVLKQQVIDLDFEKAEIVEELGEFSGLEPYYVRSAEILIFKFNDDLRLLKKELKDTKKEIELWNDPLKVKSYLKTYKIPKEEDFDFYW
ncbi:hypothetical protein [Dyadobacter sp. CY312]|uniref:hypothetical protein n=1 Tax=Dyadobacter sp. CY312 TaxID=2907303 RepID=UPI001F29FEE4|nr:hypothetical protein [Dyadobacter sp. CY312]MCE7041806.1 hypothetical protein [Dyadobacter sp. CY312]